MYKQSATSIVVNEEKNVFSSSVRILKACYLLSSLDVCTYFCHVSSSYTCLFIFVSTNYLNALTRYNLFQK